MLFFSCTFAVKATKVSVHPVKTARTTSVLTGLSPRCCLTSVIRQQPVFSVWMVVNKTITAQLRATLANDQRGAKVINTHITCMSATADGCKTAY